MKFSYNNYNKTCQQIFFNSNTQFLASVLIFGAAFLKLLLKHDVKLQIPVSGFEIGG